jgi:hypothetical protein
MKNTVVIHHHLGLGDHIICNGLINQMSISKKIYLICKLQYYKNIKYLYQNNNNVKIIPLTKVMTKSIKSEKIFSKIVSLCFFTKIKYIGFRQEEGDYFDKLFYKQADIDFKHRYMSFYVPNDSENMILVPDSKFRLIHKESSLGNYDLKIKSDDLINIFVTKDLGRNIFSYINLIKNAQEIHCVDSSFIHLVDSFKLSNSLYFHNVRKDKYKFNFNNKWKAVDY